MNYQNGKKAAGQAAAALIPSGAKVGLGTGSTAAYFIEALIERCRDGLNISAIATSTRSEKMAREGGIPLLDSDRITSIDITVDGADEIDGEKRMIKGGGGALLREKIIASISREMIVIVDESKLVDRLGAFPLPVEIIPFAHAAVAAKIERVGFTGSWRKKSDGSLFLTDSHHYIYDLSLSRTDEPEKIDSQLRSIPGVVETGFFFGFATKVLVGTSSGQVQILL
jgi:ribose 5-phosphate isomerase A